MSRLDASKIPTTGASGCEVDVLCIGANVVVEFGSGTSYVYFGKIHNDGELRTEGELRLED